MKRVVIAGGGYGGLRAVERLSGTKELEIVLIDANRYHFMQTEVYGYIAGTKDMDEIAIDLGLWCKGFKPRVRFIKDRIIALEPEKRLLGLENDVLEYDYLIIATGARTRFPESIEGLGRYGYGVKQLGRAFGFRHNFESIVKKKLEGDRSEVNIAVVGAGLSGVEVAAEMGYMLKRYEKMLGSRREDISITIIDGCETILPGLHPYLVESASKRLKELDIKILTSSFIKRVQSGQILFENGESLPYTLLIFTGGIVGNCDFVPESFEKNESNQLIVDTMLNIDGYEEIFAVGDVANILDTDGKPLPPTAQIAEKSAEYVADVIKKRLAGKKSPPFRGGMDGMFIALGGRYAVAEIFGLRFGGIGAYCMKRLVTLVYFTGIHLRANAGYKIRHLKSV